MSTKAFIVEQVALTQAEIDQFRTILALPGFTLLRDMIAARRCEALTSYLDASLYESDAAKASTETAKGKALRYTAALEVLDELGGSGEFLFRIKLDQGR